jgi:hypothetical protein
MVRRKQLKEPEYRYYLPGLFFKVFFAIALCFIYIFYYNGGDTVGYFEDSTFLINLFYKNPMGAISIFLGNTSIENHMLFDSSTGYVSSYWSDPYAYFVVRAITPLTLITQKSYLSTTILLAWICYSGVWKLFMVFCQEYPHLKSKLALAILFIPSVAFWGSGILKDTITFASVCWFTYAIYMAIIPSKRALFKPFRIGLQLFVSTYLIISLKPYVLYPLLPGVTFLILFKYVGAIRNAIIKFLFVPLVVVFSFVLSLYLLTSLGDKMGRFSFDNVLQNAVDVQYDLKQDYYQGSSFDIGEFTPTAGGVLKKFPQAVMAGLFRPFIWEARNIAMLISGLENMVFLLIVLRIAFNFKLIRHTSFITSQPLLVFAFSFSIILIFIVGLTTSNFGSLVRYRIPALPFFLASLFILEDYIKLEKWKSRNVNPVLRRSNAEAIHEADKQREVITTHLREEDSESQDIE